MDNNNILDYFPEDSVGFEKDDVIILAKIYDDNLEGQMAASLLRTQNIPNYLVGDLNEDVGGMRLYIRKEDLEKVRTVLQELPERNKIPPQKLRTINGYSPFNMVIYIFLAVALFCLFIYYFSTKK